jgi:hypothetical protein
VVQGEAHNSVMGKGLAKAQRATEPRCMLGSSWYLRSVPKGQQRKAEKQLKLKGYLQ